MTTEVKFKGKCGTQSQAHGGAVAFLSRGVRLHMASPYAGFASIVDEIASLRWVRLPLSSFAHVFGFGAATFVWTLAVIVVISACAHFATRLFHFDGCSSL